MHDHEEARRMSINPDNIDYSLIKLAASTIKKGGIVALPTETVYGLGGCVKEAGMAERLYDLKKRSKDKPFSYALSNIGRIINNYFDTLPPFGYRLIEKFWPGPLTIIYDTPKNEKIGVRVPSNIITNEILREVDEAVYLPSANISGEKEALSASEVESFFDGGIDLIVDGGKCEGSKASTVLDLTFNPFKILREGVISEEDIARVFVKKRILFVCTGNSCRSPMAQFLLEKYLRKDKAYFEDRYEIISAGISALSGAKAAPLVGTILSEKEGLDMSSFSSRLLDKYMIISSDFIFTMEDRQKDYILRFEPKTEGRVFNLSKFLSSSTVNDIPDPIGKDIKAYEESYNIIKEGLLELIDWL